MNDEWQANCKLKTWVIFSMFLFAGLSESASSSTLSLKVKIEVVSKVSTVGLAFFFAVLYVFIFLSPYLSI